MASSALSAAIPQAEREALIALYEATDGDNWRRSSDWLGPVGSECHWAGIDCNSDESAVLEIDLGFNNLTGSLPAELGVLSHLESLNLESNDLEGPIPPALGSLSALRHLTLADNQLTGSIPEVFGDLTKLDYLSLSRNQFTGAIPSSLGSLSSLETLLLYDNQLTGPIPSSLGNLSELEILILSGNELTGPIPPELTDLPRLTWLSLDHNQLSGFIPETLGGLTQLERLFLDENEFSGSIPAAFGELQGLRQLVLNDNQLTGTIPSALGSLPSLTLLDLTANTLTGPIPPELTNLENLRSILLCENQLYTDRPSVREFLNERDIRFQINDGQIDTDWETCQALPLHFAQVAEGGGLFSEILLFNLNNQFPATGRLEVRDETGAPWPRGASVQNLEGAQELELEALAFRRLTSTAGEEVRVGSARVVTDRHVGGVIVFGGEHGLAGVPSSPAFRSGFTAPVERDRPAGIDSAIAVVHLETSNPAELDLRLVDTKGAVRATAAYSLAPGAQEALFVTEIDWSPVYNLSRFSGTIQVRSSAEVTATVLQTRRREMLTMPVTALPDLAAVPAVSGEEVLYFAHFADGEGFQSQLLLLNANEETAQARVLIRDGEGNPLTVDLGGRVQTGEISIEIPPGGLEVLATDGLGPLVTGSVEVISDRPLSGVVILAGEGFGAAGVGAGQVMEEGFVAPIQLSEARRINSGLAVMNLEEEGQDLEVELLDSAGEIRATAQVSIPARGHRAFFLTELEWSEALDPGDFEGLLRVWSTGRTAATVLQTRPRQFATMPVLAAFRE